MVIKCAKKLLLKVIESLAADSDIKPIITFLATNLDTYLHQQTNNLFLQAGESNRVRFKAWLKFHATKIDLVPN